MRLGIVPCGICIPPSDRGERLKSRVRIRRFEQMGLERSDLMCRIKKKNKNEIFCCLVSSCSLGSGLFRLTGKWERDEVYTTPPENLYVLLGFCDPDRLYMCGPLFR